MVLTSRPRAYSIRFADHTPDAAVEL